MRRRFAPVRSLTVGELRDWLLSDEATLERLAALAPGLTPEMAAAVSKLMRVQDLIAAAAKIRVVTRFRTTVGLPGRLSARLQPNHPDRRCAGNCGVDHRRAADGLGRCGGRHQSRGRQRGDDGAAAADDRCASAAVPDSDAELRAGAHHNADGGARTRRAGGFAVPVDCRNRGGESQLWRESCAAAGSEGRGAGIEARRGLRERAGRRQT